LFRERERGTEKVGRFPPFQAVVILGNVRVLSHVHELEIKGKNAEKQKNSEKGRKSYKRRNCRRESKQKNYEG